MCVAEPTSLRPLAGLTAQPADLSRHACLAFTLWRNYGGWSLGRTERPSMKPRPMSLLYPRDRRPTPKITTFIDFLLRRFGEGSHR